MSIPLFLAGVQGFDYNILKLGYSGEWLFLYAPGCSYADSIGTASGGLMMKSSVSLCVLLFVFLMLPFMAAAVEVDYVSGDVQYRHLKEEAKDLDVGMTLVSGDIVETSENSEAILRDGESEIFISENASFTISEKYEEGKKRSTFILFLGRMKFKLGKSGEDEPDIQTQTVNLTIRGTEFEVGSGYDGSTIVTIDEGSVAVQGEQSELVLEEGEGTEVGFGEEPSEKFEVLTRVIDYGAWLQSSQEAVEGNESALLQQVQYRFDAIAQEIGSYELIREEALMEKERYTALRNEQLEAGNAEEASAAAEQAVIESKKAFHSIVNIRFLALSSIGLFDMAERIYTGIEEPTEEQQRLFTGIETTFGGIAQKYVLEGDRERLEEGEADMAKGCLNLF